MGADVSDASLPAPPAAPTTAPKGALMELRFELTVDDLADGSLAVAQRARTMRTVQSGVLVAVTVWMVAVSLLTGVGGAATLTGAMAMVGFLLFQRVIAPRIQREQVTGSLREGRNLYLHGQYQVRCDEEGITAGNWAMETRVRWAAIEKVVTTPKQVLLYYGGSRALVIPRRAFTSDEQASHFVELARSLGEGAYRQLTARRDG